MRDTKRAGNKDGVLRRKGNKRIAAASPRGRREMTPSRHPFLIRYSLCVCGGVGGCAEGLLTPTKDTLVAHPREGSHTAELVPSLVSNYLRHSSCNTQCNWVATPSLRCIFSSPASHPLSPLCRAMVIKVHRVFLPLSFSWSPSVVVAGEVSALT
jgi:hypothetical protein